MLGLLGSVAPSTGFQIGGRTPSVRVVVQAEPMMKGMSSSGVRCEKSRQRRKAADGLLVPVGRNVLPVTTRLKRSGSMATSRSPMRPPQSWQKSVIRRRLVATRKLCIHATWRSYV